MKPYSIKLLGRAEVQTAVGTAVAQTGTKTTLLLARLAMAPERGHDRKRLTELLWPDRSEEQAQASLRQTLWMLRKALGDEDQRMIQSDRTTVRLDQDRVEIDTLAFERLIRRGTREDLEQAAQLYRGDYLTEVDLDDSESLAPFLFERRRLQTLYLSCLKSSTAIRAAAGEVDGALETAFRALAVDFLQEDFHAAVMRLYRDRGQPGLARRQYELCREALKKELGVAPSPEIEAIRLSLNEAPLASVTTGGEVQLPPGSIAPTGSALPARRRLRAASVAVGLGACAALVIGLATALVPRAILPSEAGRPRERPSLVVLPFRAAGKDDPASAYAAGLTGSLINDLAKISGLLVISADTSRGLDDPAVSARQEASELGVDFAMEGRVERHDDAFRVKASLVRADSGVSVWEKAYDQRGGEVYPVQDSMVHEVAAVLGVGLSDPERRSVNRIPTSNLEAQDYYLRAETQAIGLAESDGLRRALANYRRAFELDPNFAEAWAGYARVAATVWRGDFNEIMSSAVARNEAYGAAGRAMQIDPENARAYEVLSIIQAVEGEHRLAVETARKAVTFQPGDAEAHTNLATVLFFAGDLDGTAAEIALARRLNPAMPKDLQLVSAQLAFAQHRYSDAITQFDAIRQSTPRSELVMEHLAAAYAYLGKQADAQAIVAELEDLVPVTNLGLYAVMTQNVGSPDQVAHFLEGLRRAGIPPWPFDERRRPEDRLDRDELRKVIAGPAWNGVLANGVAFTQYFDRGGSFAYASTTTLLTGRVEFRNDQLCQVIGGYLLGRPSCGYVYRNRSETNRHEGQYVYVSIDAVKYFSVSR